MASYLILPLLCIAVAVQGLTPEQEEIVKGTFKECIASTGVNPEVIHKSRQGEFADDPKVGEFSFCFFKKIGFMNDAGELQAEVIKTSISTLLSAADLNAVIEKCKNVTGKDNNEKAYNVYKCYWNATPNHITLTM